ncbi:MAG: hypothetical protein JXB04_04420 [Kiritimatiellae bacterium]|nr:hypothetical protein [Kiritimatiellia bacterium]
MKRLGVAILVITALAACIVFAQTNQVLSRNAVGYTRVVVPKGGLVLVRMDFEDLAGGDLHAADVIGDQMPMGSVVYHYDNGLGGYATDNKTVLGWSTNIIFDRGMGLWLRVPSTAVSNEYVVYLMGEVPDRFTAPTSQVAVASGITQLGYLYPADVLWTNTTLAKNSKLGDVLYWWDGSNYVANNRSVLGWANPNLVLTPSMGFWFKTTAAATNWIEDKPYTWP